MKKKKTIKLLKPFKDMDKTLLVVSILLFVFGLLNIATASSSEAVTRYNYDTFHYFIRQLVFLIVAIIPFIYIINTKTKKFKGYAFLGYIIVLGLLIYLLLYGVANKGVIAWINVFGFTFQPSEFSKPIIIVLLAVLFDSNKKLIRSDKKERYSLFGLFMFIGIVIPLILLIQKDLGTSMIILFIFTVMFLASPILRSDKFKITIIFSVAGLIFLLGIIGFAESNVLTPAQMSRFDFFDPCTRYETSGYQTCNAFIAINDGGLFGLGIGKSKQKYSYLAEPHTDSIFAIVSEEYGFIRTSFLFLGYAIVLQRILDISSKANTTRGRYMTLGVAAYIFIHIFLNLGGLFAIIPLTGVPLPFLTYGGTYAISLVIALAVVQRVQIETKNQHLKI